MADNNYQEGNSIEDLKAFTNPYASSTNSLKLKGIKKVNCCNYLASFGYVIAAGGATTTITPLTGNLSGDLRYYRVTVSDGTLSVAGELDYASPAAAFVIDTSPLNASAAWTLEFSGALEGGIGSADCSLDYKVHLCCGDAVAGASGDSIPADWENVSFNLVLDTTDDVNFTLFPAEGVEIAAGQSLDIGQYSTAGQLATGLVYYFLLEVKKVTNNPSVTAANETGNFSSVYDQVGLPLVISNEFGTVSEITADTAAPASLSSVFEYTLSNEGVVPSVSFTLTATVA